VRVVFHLEMWYSTPMSVSPFAPNPGKWTSEAGVAPAPRYLRPAKPLFFPESEEMPETNLHLELRTALYLILKHTYADRATIGSEQFVYYDPTNPGRRLAPDAFVRMGSPHAPFRVWKVWERGAPEVGVEVVSDSDADEPALEEKLERYRAAGIGHLARFDPTDAQRPLRIWDHVGGDLVERDLSDPEGHWCAALGAYWVVAPSGELGSMLRLSRDAHGSDLLPLPEEAAKRELRAAVQAQLAAERERERAKEELENERRERLRLEEELRALRGGGPGSS
jgi:Uma2 family endonuclease